MTGPFSCESSTNVEGIASTRIMMDLLNSPFDSAFAQFADEIVDECYICSPYITYVPMKALVDTLGAKKLKTNTKINVVTDISFPTLVSGGTEIPALLYLFKKCENVRITYLPKIHAKVYIANRSSAIVASANFTHGGTKANFEYGVRVKERTAVRKIRRDIDAYRKLGADLTKHELHTFNIQVREIKSQIKNEQREIHNIIKSNSVEQQRMIENNLIRARVKNNNVNAIFSETLLYLLSRRPATTIELNALVKNIHPDLCDDSVDRVIDNVTYGKLWKHGVRNAQQTLKRARRIAYDKDAKQWRIAN